MQRLFSPRSWHRLATATAAACLLTAASAAAQVGTAVTPLNVQGYPNRSVAIGFSDEAQANAATAAGGVTLFSAHVPNGPLLARLALFPPFVSDPESGIPFRWNFSGVPPGSYYVAVVYGIVDAPSIPVAHWTRLVVPGACTGAPGVASVERRSPDAEPSSVQLLLTNAGGCATSYLVDVGTSPGATNVASFEHAGILLSATGVPAGSYYVRVRGRNQFGIGPHSAVLPLRVPGCLPEPVEIGSELTATVAGQQVTLTWTAPVPAPQYGGPITYYELARLDGSSPLSPPVPFLFPVTASRFTATVPSGTYAVGLYAGNACWSSPIASVAFTVP
jgi:hypothetical protein